jgi:hypothetical protein
MQARGIIKRWNGSWGIIYAPESLKYYLHISKVVEGRHALCIGRIVTFEIGPARSETELEQALDVHVSEMAPAPTRTAPAAIGGQ